MLKLLRYFYYVLYKFAMSNGEYDKFVGTWIVGTFIGINFFSGIDFIFIILKTKSININTGITISLGIILYYLVHILLSKGDKPKKILEEFSNASKREKVWLNIFLVLYIILSIGLVIYTGNIIRSGSYLK